MLFSPGISVRKDAEVARMAVPMHAMHDPTEGGLATALRELAAAAGVGLEVEQEAIPVLPACRTFCDALGLDPLGLIASGALLATVAAEDAAPLIEALGVEGIPAWEIGRVTPAGEGPDAADAVGDGAAAGVREGRTGSLLRRNGGVAGLTRSARDVRVQQPLGASQPLLGELGLHGGDAPRRTRGGRAAWKTSLRGCFRSPFPLDGGRLGWG